MVKRSGLRWVIGKSLGVLFSFYMACPWVLEIYYYYCFVSESKSYL